MEESMKHLEKYLREILTVLLICPLVLVALCPVPAAGAGAKDLFQYEIQKDPDTGENCIYLRSAKAQKNLVIPAEIDGMPVRFLSKEFAWNTDGMKEVLTTLTIEADLRGIPARSFQYCQSLTSVRLPDSIEIIGDGAFDGCYALTEINFPKNLKAIGNRAFGWCRFTEANLPDTVMTIDEQAFCCVPLTSLHLSENLRSIGKIAFEYNHLQSLYIPASVESVGSRAFGASNYLEKVIIAGADTVFEPDAFEDEDHKGLSFQIVCTEGSSADTVFSGYEPKSYDLDTAFRQYADGVGQVHKEGDWQCIGLEDGTGMIINLPKNKSSLIIPAVVDGLQVTVIGDSGSVNAEGYQKVSSVTIPEGVVEIRDRAFSSFRALNSVKFPKTLKKIGDEAFNQCNLKSVHFPEGLEVIGKKAFAGNRISQIALPFGVRTVGDEAFQWCDVKSLKLPDSLEEIGKEAFRPFKGSSLIIPSSVRKIGSCAFGPNGSQRAWTVTFLSTDTELGNNAFGDSGNMYYISQLNYDIPKVTVSCLPGSTADRYFKFDAIKKYQTWGEECVFTAPDDTVFSPSSLPDGQIIYEVIIPEGVEEIEAGAFIHSGTLAKIALPSTLKRIGENAFAGCPLTEVSIPETVEFIGAGAFRACSNLKKVSFSSAGLMSVIGSEAFKQCGQLVKISLPKGLKEIGESAFAETGLTAVAVPESVAVIGAGAFMNCEALTKVSLPAGLTEIPDHLCDFCRELKSVNIPASTVRIGASAFRRCRLISSVTFPEGLEEIGDSAFEQFVSGAEMGYGFTNGRETYTRIKSIKLPSTLKKLGRDAFIACDAVTSITFAPGCSIEAIGDETFAACTHLKSIVLPDTVISVGKDAFTECFMLSKADLGSSVSSIGDNAFRRTESLKELIVPDTVKVIGTEILREHGGKLTVVCGEGSAMEEYLKTNYPEVKISFRK